jgi:hypothetical protein
MVLWRRRPAGVLSQYGLGKIAGETPAPRKAGFPSRGMHDYALRIGFVIKSTKSFLKRTWSISCRTFTKPADGGGPR